MTMIERPRKRTVTPSQRELDTTEDAVWYPVPRYVLLWRAFIGWFRY
jgi:hypothetical protein